MELSGIAALGAKIRENVAKVIVGKDDEIELLLVALIAGGHALIEDVPGTGKTVMAKALAKSIDCQFKRIQFTPDLLPTDITGMNVFNQKEFTFEFRRGPVFSNILLTDEINRATPRTQSALLECMEERQVTVDGVSHKLHSPFFVVATQNPVETSGTFALPEAQLDRFLLQLSPGYPDTAGSRRILDRFIQDDPLAELLPVASGEEIVLAQNSFQKVYVSGPVRGYIVALAEGTRASEEVSLGISPRGMLGILRAAQVYAALSGREYVLPDDVKKLVKPVFAHRLILRSGYGGGKKMEFLDSLIGLIPAPTEDAASDRFE